MNIRKRLLKSFIMIGFFVFLLIGNLQPDRNLSAQDIREGSRPGDDITEDEIDPKTNPETNSKDDNVIVAIVDSGLDTEDERIPEKRVIYPQGNKVIEDTYGHGTEMAALIASNTPDSVMLLPISVTEEDGSASVAAVSEGIRTAAEQGADIIHLSMNTTFYSDGSEITELVDALTKEGIFVVVSAGNDAMDTEFLVPANIESAIVVGAVDENKERYYFSNYGNSVDYYSCGNYGGKLGTSYAAAYVTSMIAELEAGGVTDMAEIINQLKESCVSIQEGENYLWKEDMDIGAGENKTQLTLGSVAKTKHNLGLDIINIDWKALDRKTLDQYFAETDFAYVGLFLQQLPEGEQKQILAKSDVLNSEVVISNYSYSEGEDAYNISGSKTLKYYDYCLQSCNEHMGRMTMSWLCKSENLVFYISSPDRNIIYKYTIKGLYDKGFSGSDAFVASDLSIVRSLYKNAGLSYDGTYSAPNPVSISRIIPTVRAHLTEYYETDGTLDHIYTFFERITTGTDDGAYNYSISIKFDSYVNTRTGYHSDASAIAMYNADDGIGTSTKDAMVYLNPEVNLSDTYTSYQKYKVKFNTMKTGYIKYYYNGVFKAGKDHTNSTSNADLESWTEGKLNGVKFYTDISSIKDNSEIVYINTTDMNLFGVNWYESLSNTLAAWSDVPELVFALAPNTYTIKYYGNGATGGSTADSTHTYDKSQKLTANGFTRTDYTFVGWNTKADGTGTSYPDQKAVKNLTATNGATIKLYAQWKYDGYSITYELNGGTVSKANPTQYTVNTATFTLNNPTKVGNTFDGWTEKISTSNWETGYITSAGVFASSSASYPNAVYSERILIKSGIKYTISGTNLGSVYWRVFDADGNFLATKSGSSYTPTENCYVYVLLANGASSTNRNNAVISSSPGTTVKILKGSTGDRIYEANWTPVQDNVTYTVKFDRNDGGGLLSDADITASGSMPDVTMASDTSFTFPANTFLRENPYGASGFLGWSLDKDATEPTWTDCQTIEANTLAAAAGVAGIDGATITLYAIWDDFPWILAEDLYYTLEQAQRGDITYDEVMGHATAIDREDGSTIPPGVDEVTGTAFQIIDYAPEDFTQFCHGGSVTETYQVIDSAGNTYKKMITVHIVDTTPAAVKPAGTTRFISEKYYNAAYENGGLADNSIWKTDPEYAAALEEAFANSRNDTPVRIFTFTHEEILSMKEFVRENGVGNTKNAGALQLFYDQFMVAD